MSIRNPVLFVVLCIFLTTHCAAQTKKVVISVDTLSQNVFMLTGQGGNIGIYIGETNVFMIDDQFARLSDKIKVAIGSLTDKPVATLFNTHMHGDHSGGNANFNSDAVTLVAHDNVRDRIKASQQKKLEKQEITASYLENMLPEVTFSEDITFYDGDETIMAFHIHHAHTDGDADPNNEIETWATLAGIPSDIADGDDDNQTLTLSGNNLSISKACLSNVGLSKNNSHKLVTPLNLFNAFLSLYKS